MKPILLAATLMLCSCTQGNDEHAPTSPKPRVLIPDHVLRVFGGRLLGTDHGEWIGKLQFQDKDGALHTLLKENVHGIVKNEDGIFAFTRLAHLSVNEGAIYLVAMRTDNGELEARPLKRLPGSPSDVRQLEKDITTFLVNTGYSGDHLLYECYSLIGSAVNRSYDCAPPK